MARHEAYAWHWLTRRFPSLEAGAAKTQKGGECMDMSEFHPAAVDVELAFDAREALRSLAALGDRRRTALTLKVAGYSYCEIQDRLGVTFTWINRHITEGRAQLRREAEEAEACVEVRSRQSR